MRKLSAYRAYREKQEALLATTASADKLISVVLGNPQKRFFAKYAIKDVLVRCKIGGLLTYHVDGKTPTVRVAQLSKPIGTFLGLKYRKDTNDFEAVLKLEDGIDPDIVDNGVFKVHAIKERCASKHHNGQINEIITWYLWPKP